MSKSQASKSFYFSPENFLKSFRVPFWFWNFDPPHQPPYIDGTAENVNVVVPHFLFRVTCNFLHFRKGGGGGHPAGTFSISEKYPVAAPMS
jgi:hypothetical protein